MQVPSILQGESLKRLLQGAAVGAVATIFVGFSWGGWSLGSTADKMAKEQSERAVVAALAPVCVERFQRAADVSVDHPHVVQNYRVAHDIAVRQQRGDASTEDLRVAMVHYRALFDDLLDSVEPMATEAHR